MVSCPLWPRTDASAVPQLPPPITAARMRDPPEIGRHPARFETGADGRHDGTQVARKLQCQTPLARWAHGETGVAARLPRVRIPDGEVVRKVRRVRDGRPGGRANSRPRPLPP